MRSLPGARGTSRGRIGDVTQLPRVVLLPVLLLVDGADGRARKQTRRSDKAQRTSTHAAPHHQGAAGVEVELQFDGDGIAKYDKVVCAELDGNDPGTYPAELMPAAFTVACWTKLDSFECCGGIMRLIHPASTGSSIS